MASGEKVLSLKARRSQLQARLDDWHTTFHRIHNRDATAADMHRSSQHRELSRLVSDVDRYIASLESGAVGLAPRATPQDAERRAERGRIKARMRRWDKDFERMHSRKPTDADHEQSEEFARLKQQLVLGQDVTDRNASSISDGRSADNTVDNIADSTTDSSSTIPASKGAPFDGDTIDAPLGPGTSGDAGAGWWQGNDYNELLRARVQSQSAVNGFEGVSAAEVHSGAAMFANWDLDHDGVLGGEEFAFVINSLAQHAGRSVDADTVQRLFTLMDCTGNGKVDFNEFLAIYKQRSSGSF